MFGVDIIDYDGKMAVAVAKRIGLVAIEIDGQFDLEGRGGMTQIDQREIRKLDMIGNFKAEGARVEIQRFRLVEHADHRVNGFCHSVQPLEIGDDGGAGLRFGLACASRWHMAFLRSDYNFSKRYTRARDPTIPRQNDPRERTPISSSRWFGLIPSTKWILLPAHASGATAA